MLLKICYIAFIEKYYIGNKSYLFGPLGSPVNAVCSLYNHVNYCAPVLWIVESKLLVGLSFTTQLLSCLMLFRWFNITILNIFEEFSDGFFW